MGVGPLEQGVHRRQQPFHGGRGEWEHGVLDDGLLEGKRDHGVVVDAMGELPCPPARNPELVDERLRPHGRDIAHGVQAEAAHAVARLGIDREQVDATRRKEGGRIRRDARNTRRVAGQGRHERGELGGADPDARPADSAGSVRSRAWTVPSSPPYSSSRPSRRT